MVETDHKRLEIAARKSLLSTPNWLQRMLLQLQRHNLEIVYHPSDQQWIADTLSQLPVNMLPTGEATIQEVFQMEQANIVSLEMNRIEGGS